MYENILVPLDGSKLAEQVLSHVGDLARAFNSEVTLINICESEEKKGGQACSLYMHFKADDLKNSIGISGAKVKTEILIGVPEKKILDYANTEKVNLIVMASHGHSGIMLWPMGGTADKVIRKINVPLIVVRVKENPAEMDKSGLFRKILIPLDGSQKSAAVLPYASEIANKLGSEVILFHVVEPGKQVHTFGGLNYVPYRYEDLESGKKKAMESLHEAGSQFSGAKAKLRYEVVAGNAAREIIGFAAKEDCSLIALSSHGHSGIEAWTLGSVTYKILQSGNRSVLFVPVLEK